MKLNILSVGRVKTQTLNALILLCGDFFMRKKNRGAKFIKLFKCNFHTIIYKQNAPVYSSIPYFITVINYRIICRRNALFKLQLNITCRVRFKQFSSNMSRQFELYLNKIEEHFLNFINTGYLPETSSIRFIQKKGILAFSNVSYLHS